MKNYFDLSGQVAVVTGASAGLGLQMAKAFANQGANLVLLARRINLLEENAKAISEEFGVEVLPVACDITNTEMVQAAVKATIEKFGRVDILVNNAGTGAVANAEDITDEQFKHGITVNSICPGYFYTDLTTATLDSDYFQAIAKSNIPLQRYGKAGELDSCAIFLAAPTSTYVNGQNIAVDGGYTCV